MIELFENMAVIWFIAAAILISLEVMLAPGIGLLFAGLGALTTGLLITLGIVDNNAVLLQVAVFLITTSIWALALWKPMKNLLLRNKASEYKNIVGERAKVTGNKIQKNKSGKVSWSGTELKARLDKGSIKDSVEPEEEVEILRIEGNTAIIIPVKE